MKASEVLTPAKGWVKFRRWLGFYTHEEREVLDYAKRMKDYALRVTRQDVVLTARPNWMRHEDYKRLRQLQKKSDRKIMKGGRR